MAQLRAQATRLRIAARRLVGREGGGPLVARRRGLGCEFLELRDYAAGDDVRRIDWKGSARASKLLVREYYEDVRRTICIVYDRSSSMELVADAARSCALLILYAAERAGDAVGLIQFDEQATVILPSRVRSVTRRIERELLAPVHTRQRTTQFSQAIEALSVSMKERSLICVISDGIDRTAQHALARIATRHDTLLFRIADADEQALANFVYCDAEDPERGIVCDARSNLAQESEKFFEEQRAHLVSQGVSVCPIVAGPQCYEEIIRFFIKRRNAR